MAHVLVVDDSPTIRRVVSHALAGAGHAVVVAADGAAGLAAARAAVPDLIVLDFVMPGMNGYQLMRALADDERLGGVPVVLMHTRVDPLVGTLGAAATLLKPFSPEALLAAATAALESRRAWEAAPTEVSLPAFDAPDIPAMPGVRDFAQRLADALFAHGVRDAELVARAVTHDVASSLPALSGDLSAIALPEVLHLLKAQGQTGVLEVTLGAASIELSFQDGGVVGVRGRNVRGDLLLGRYFVARGHVSAQELDTVLARGGEAPLGERLVEAGLVTADVVRDCLGEQAQDLMYEMLRAPRGVFGLRRGAPAASAASYSVDGLLFEGLRRIDEWSVIQRDVPSLAAQFARVHGADDAGLTVDEREVFLLLDDEPRAVEDLILRSRQRAFDVCHALRRLVSLQRAARVDEMPVLVGIAAPCAAHEGAA